MGDPIGAARCRQVWCNVVLQAAADILTVPKIEPGFSAYRPSTVEHWQAVSWLGSRDFRLVCALAGLEPSAVEQGLRRRLAEVVSGKVTMRELFRSRGGAAQRRGLEATDG